MDPQQPMRTTYACYGCEQHIDGESVNRRTIDGWMPFHPVCDPGPGDVARIVRVIRGGSFKRGFRGDYWKMPVL